MSVKPIPDGYHTITPYLTVLGAAKLIDFLKRTFDARVSELIEGPDGSIRHAEVRIGDSFVMIAEPRGEWTATPASLYVYVSDTDATYKRAIAAGGVSLMEPADQFYGDRNAGVKDACGNSWWIATHLEDVPHDELVRRSAAAQKQH